MGGGDRDGGGRGGPPGKKVIMGLSIQEKVMIIFVCLLATASSKMMPEQLIVDLV